MIPTTKGAAKVVFLVLPQLEGKLNGLAIRVPTPNVSIVDIVINVEKTGVTVTEVNQSLKATAGGELKGILGFSELPLVSTDFTVEDVRERFTDRVAGIVEQVTRPNKIHSTDAALVRLADMLDNLKDCPDEAYVKRKIDVLNGKK